MTFFFDNNISPKVADILRVLDVDAMALREAFDPSIKDVDLFPELAGSGVILVTADTRMTRTPVEIQGLQECGVSAIFFRRFWAKMTLWDQVRWLGTHWQQVQAEALRWEPPVYFDVDRSCKITRREF